MSLREALPPLALLKVFVLAGLLVWLNYWQLPPLVSRWRWDPNWSHGFLIPLFSLYLLYVRREELLSARRRVSLWGLALTVLSILFMVYTVFSLRVRWAQQLSMIPLIMGLTLYLAGWRVLRYAWLPICYLGLAMPLPGLLYERISVPLQNFAAKMSTVILQAAGVRIESAASKLFVWSVSGINQTLGVAGPYELTVAEACSGVRSLMAYLAIGIGLAYIEDRPLWHRAILVVSTVPVAILCNVIRVAGTCTMYVIDKPEWGQDFMHTFMGLLMLAPALLMLLGINALLNALYHDEDDDEIEPSAASEPQERPATPAPETEGASA